MPKQKIIKIHSYDLTIKEIKEVASKTTEVTLDIKDENFTFRAGQYIRITITSLPEESWRGNTRDFSITSSPNNKETISFTFRNSDSVFKKTLLQMKTGDKLSVQGPLGAFTLPEDYDIPLIFIAGGIGITPFISMIRFISENKLPYNVQLIYSNSKIEKATYLEELKKISDQSPNIKLIEKLHRTNVAFIKEKTEYSEKTLWFICGIPKMVINLTQQIPKDLNIPEQNIRQEEYTGYDRARKNYIVYQASSETTAEIKGEESEINETLVKPLLDAIGQTALVAITDTQGSILYINQKFIDIAKYTREELIGQNHRILKSGFHPPGFYEELWKTISSGQIWRGEIKNRAKDGTFYWVDTSITPIFNEDSNNIERYIAVRFLITDRKNLEKAKKNLLTSIEEVEKEKKITTQEKDKLNTILHSIGDGVFVINNDKKIILFNQVAANLSGYTVDEAIGQSYDKVLNFVNEKDGLKKEQFILDTFLNKKTNSTRTNALLIHKNGSKIAVANSSSALQDKQGNIIGAVVVFQDVTQEHKIDKTKTEFVSLASHQLKTPLTSISWNTEILLSGTAGPITTDQKDKLDAIGDSNKRMIDLVEALLNVSRLELGTFVVEPSPINTVELMQSVIEELKPSIIKKKLKIISKFIENPPIIPLDKNLTRIIFQNLLSNAIKYTPENGEINVTIGIGESKENIIISVSDTGYGIPKEQQARVFTKLFRASNAQTKETDGTGLGLYIVKSILDHTDGKIQFTSKENEGTTFHVSMPLKGMSNKKGAKQLS